MSSTGFVDDIIPQWRGCSETCGSRGCMAECFLTHVVGPGLPEHWGRSVLSPIALFDRVGLVGPRPGDQVLSELR